MLEIIRREIEQENFAIKESCLYPVETKEDLCMLIDNFKIIPITYRGTVARVINNKAIEMGLQLEPGTFPNFKPWCHPILVNEENGINPKDNYPMFYKDINYYLGENVGPVRDEIFELVRRRIFDRFATGVYFIEYPDFFLALFTDVINTWKEFSYDYICIVANLFRKYNPDMVELFLPNVEVIDKANQKDRITKTLSSPTGGVNLAANTLNWDAPLYNTKAYLKIKNDILTYQVNAFDVENTHPLKVPSFLERISNMDEEERLEVSDALDELSNFFSKLEVPDKLKVNNHNLDTTREEIPFHLNRLKYKPFSVKGKLFVVHNGEATLASIDTDSNKLCLCKLDTAKESLSITELITMTPKMKTPHEVLTEGITIDKDGTVKIDLPKNMNYMDEYASNHRMLKEAMKNKNYEEAKLLLAYDFALIDKIEHKLKNSKIMLPSKKNDLMKARQFLINDFKSYLKLIVKEEPSFNFAEYYYNCEAIKEVITVDSDTINGIKALLRTIFL